MARNLTEVVSSRSSLFVEAVDSCLLAVSRLFAHSTNYDMDLTLDYNIELYPLKQGQSFSLVLASSLARGGGPGEAADGAEDEKDAPVWRPDGKGKRGLEEDYEYVMYGKVRSL